LNNALEKHKESSREVRDLEATLEHLSRTSDEHRAHWAKVEKEKTTLEARVNELESQLRTVSQPAPSFTPGRRIPKPRSSSLSNIRINTLEQDLTGLRSQLANKGAEVGNMSHKLSRALQDRNKAENERIAVERKWQDQIETLQTALDEKEEELAFLREQLGDGSREDELLKRIEEDDAKIAALEIILRDTDDSQEHKGNLRRLEIHLNEERHQREQLEGRCISLLRERDEALEALGEVRQEAAGLASELDQRQLRDEDFEER
jgi:chromosome segregation ATPase